MCSNVSSNRLPERRHIHTGCIYSFLGHCVLSNVCSKRLYKRKQSRTGCICLTFLQCAFSNGFSKCLYVGMHITEGCSKAPTRSGQPSPESCAPPSPPSYTSSSPAYPSLTLHMGRLCSMWATTMFSKVRGIDLQNVVLLHLDLTPVWRSTWSGSALCGPPPSPPHEPELQTHSLSLLILSFLSDGTLSK